MTSEGPESPRAQGADYVDGELVVTWIEWPDRVTFPPSKPLAFGERRKFIASPIAPFRPSALILHGEGATAFQVDRFVSGLFDQLGGAPWAGVHFVAMGHAWPVLGRCDVCAAREELSIDVVNVDAARRAWPFSATIYGRHV